MDDEEGAGLVNDPHMWMDVTRVITYVENIRKGLTEFDPEGAAVYQSNATAYTAKLKDLDAWIVEQVSQNPRGKKAVGYQPRRAGLFLGPLWLHDHRRGVAQRK